MGHVETAALLLSLPASRGVDPASNSNIALRTASRLGHPAVVRLLLETRGRGIDPTGFDNEALRWACIRGNTETVRLLLNANREDGDTSCVQPTNDPAISSQAAPASQGPAGPSSAQQAPPRSRPALAVDLGPARTRTHSSQSARQSTFRSSEVPGGAVDATARDNYALRVAAENGHHAIVAMLLAWKPPAGVAGGRRVDPRTRGCLPLIQAARRGRGKVLRVLLALNDDRAITSTPDDPFVIEWDERTGKGTFTMDKKATTFSRKKSSG
jgi:ankyrin repeat protein